MQVAPTPSLVSSLQKIHGLSRKKIYGTQSARPPFVREEPVRAKYRQAPTPLFIPGSAEERHGCTNTKVDSIRSPGRASQASGLSDPTSPGRRSPRNNQGISPSDMTCPAPGYPESTGYSAVPSTNFSPKFRPITSFNYPGAGAGVDSTNLLTSVLHPQSSPTVISDHPGSPWTSATQHGTETQLENVGPNPRRYSLEARHSTMQNSSAIAKVISAVPLGPVDDSKLIAAGNASSTYKDAGDAPFLFCPELEAATAARLKAALQSSSHPQVSSPTPKSNYTIDGTCASDLFFSCSC